MDYTVTVLGRTFRRVAWTGGDTPASYKFSQSWPTWPAYMAIACVYYREQLGHYVAYWGTMPDRDTRMIFWTRATADAWRTLTSQD